MTLRKSELLRLFHRAGLKPDSIVAPFVGEYRKCFKVRRLWHVRAGQTALTWQEEVLQACSRIEGYTFERVACYEVWKDYPQHSYFDCVVRVQRCVKEEPVPQDIATMLLTTDVGIGL